MAWLRHCLFGVCEANSIVQQRGPREKCHVKIMYGRHGALNDDERLWRRARFDR